MGNSPSRYPVLRAALTGVMTPIGAVFLAEAAWRTYEGFYDRALNDFVHWPDCRGNWHQASMDAIQ
jgi:hypothetical protein